MKITKIESIPLNIPVDLATKHSFQKEVRTEFGRVIVKVHTEDGLIGYGESWCSASVLALIEKYKDILIGTSPFAIENFQKNMKMGPYWSGYASWSAISALEIACWDLIGKITKRPICDLIGGQYRNSVEFCGYLFYREGEGAEDIIDYAEEIVEEHGFRVLKVKAGVYEPAIDIKITRLLREKFGEKMGLRVDPNGAWSIEESIRIADALRPYDLEYLEDPVWGLESMSRLRKDIRMPIATNMFVVNFQQIPVAFRIGAVDVILSDPHKFGGISGVKRLAAVCDTLQLGMSYHSSGMFGIGMATALHIGASTPNLTYALDSHYHHMSDDIIEGGPFVYKDGKIDVPTGNGLGITIDEDKVDYYHRRFQDKRVFYDAL